MSNPEDPDQSPEVEHFEPVAGIEQAATGTAEQPDIVVDSAKVLKPSKLLAILILAFGLLASLYVAAKVDVHWIEQKTVYNTYPNNAGELVYTYKGQETLVGEVTPYLKSPLRQEALSSAKGKPELESQWVVETISQNGIEQTQYALLEAKISLRLLVSAACYHRNRFMPCHKGSPHRALQRRRCRGIYVRPF